MLKCPNCGRENAEHFNFCLDCGYDLKAMRDVFPTSPAPAAGGGSGPSTQWVPVMPPLATTASGPAVPPAAALPTASSPVMAVAQPADVFAPTPVLPPPSMPPPAPLPAASPATMPPPSVAVAGVPCPACAHPNAPGMKFCGNCGKRLDGAPAEPEGTPRTMFMHAASLKAQPTQICKLVTIDQTGREGMTFTLRAGETLCGRTNGIILFDDAFVSPTHCRFTFAGSRLKVTDLGSLNGVYVRLKSEHTLSDGELVRLGRQLFRFELLNNAAFQVKRIDGDDSKIWGSPAQSAFGRIVQILDDGRTGEIRLLLGDRCQIGREIGDIVLPHDGFVSGRHCVFTRVGDAISLQDLGSSNGTYLRVRGEADVGHGDFLLVGNQMLRVEIV